MAVCLIHSLFFWPLHGTSGLPGRTTRNFDRAVSGGGLSALLALILIVLMTTAGSGEPFNASGADQTSGVANVYAGVYILNIGKLDLATGEYDIDFYLSLKGDRPFEMDEFEFMNGRAVTRDAIIDLPEEKYYRILASLYADIDLRDYPFDVSSLSMELEDKVNDGNSISFIYDSSNSGIDPHINLVGWQLDGFRGEVKPHCYPIYNETFSRFQFHVDISRPGTSTMIKSFLPIVFMLLITLLTLFIKESMIETRLKLNISILIASVLFHVSIGNSLPPIAYLTLVDKTMLFVYMVLVATLLYDVLIARRLD